MYDIAHITICGRLAVDPEMKLTEDQIKYTTFALAVNQDKEEACFFSVYCFGQLAQYSLDQLSKGSRVSVIGKLKQIITSEGKKILRVTAEYIFPGNYKIQGIKKNKENKDEEYV